MEVGEEGRGSCWPGFEVRHTVPRRELVDNKELAGSVRVGAPSGTVDSWDT